MKKKKILTKIFLLTSSFLVSIIIGEFLLRVFYADSLVLFPRYQTEANYKKYKIRKHFSNVEFFHSSIEGKWKFKTNNKGFRNYNTSVYSKEPGVLRILSVGDSHTFGYEVNQDSTFSYQLSKILNRPGIPAEVFNTGVSGFSTAEELVFIENEGIKYQPDYIVLGFFANDYDDNIRSGLFELTIDSLEEKNHEYLPGIEIQKIIYDYKIFKWLGENSYLYSFVFNSIWNYFKEISIKGSSESAGEYSIVNNITADEYKVKLAAKLLSRIYQFCDRNNIGLILIDIPYKNINGEVESSLKDILKIGDSKRSHHTFSFYDLKKKLIPSEMHTEKGHSHISEKTHSEIAKYCGSVIISERKYTANP